MDYLGECPVWDASTQTLYWLDLIGRRLHKLRWGERPRAPLELNVQIAAITTWMPEGLLAVTSRGIESLDPETGELVHFLPPPWSSAEVPNDAKCDSRGRLWLGTKDASGGITTGTIYCIDQRGDAHLIERGFGNINGFGWSSDGTRMYVTDTRRSEIYSCAFQIETGQCSARQVLAKVDPKFGRPDGLTVDTDGFIWSANWEGGCVMRHDPNGKPAQIHPVEAACPTSCAFGGPFLDRLFVTVALVRSDPHYFGLIDQPLALSDMAQGVEAPIFAGKHLQP